MSFQDFSWKLNFPTKRAGTFSVFGLGFFDTNWDERMKIKDTHSAYDASDNDSKLAQLLAGVSHKILLGNKWTWRSTLAYNMQHIKDDEYYYGLKRDENDVLIYPLEYEEPEQKYLFSKQKINEDRIIFNTELSKQVNDKWLTQFGGEYSHRFFNLVYRSADRLLRTYCA